jgi:FkbM family methyltransferase
MCNRIIRLYLKIPYATSILPSSLLARGMRSTSLVSYPCFLIAILFYGMDRYTRRLLWHYMDERRISPEKTFQGQMLQDAWVDSMGIQISYFIDIGAAFPVKFSNSYALQQRKWSGLLVEPNSTLLIALEARKSQNVEIARVAVSTSSGTSQLVRYGPLSSLIESATNDIYGAMRQLQIEQGNTEEITTQSFADLIATYKIPSQVGYLSIDVEGLDFEILQQFPFDLIQVQAVTIEHNLDLTLRSSINEFMKKQGFKRVSRRWSSIDSWFVKTGLV